MGRPGSRVETRYRWEAQTGAETTEVTGTYYVRSTVLGGAAVAELDEAGGKRRGCVYMGAEKLAEHEFFFGVETVTWRLADAARGSWVEADAGRVAVRRELDPLGSDVGAADPYASSAQPSYAELMERDPIYGERGNALDIRGGCTLDGLAISCSEAMNRLDRGIAGFDSVATISYFDGERRQTFAGRTSLPPGIDAWFGGESANQAARAFNVGSIWGGFDAGVQAALVSGLGAVNSVEGPGRRRGRQQVRPRAEKGNRRDSGYGRPGGVVGSREEEGRGRKTKTWHAD